MRSIRLALLQRSALSSRRLSTSSYVEKTPITAYLWKMREEHKFKASQNQGTTSEDAWAASIKKPSESRVDIRYQFATDACLRALYVDSFGGLLMGKLLEDLDALAGNVAFFHCDDGTPENSPLSLVTASVEKIDVLKIPIPIDNNLIVTGQVVFVGNSSLDVLVEAHLSTSNVNSDSTESPAILDPAAASSRVLSSVFTYVARSKETGRAAKVNQLNLFEATSFEKSFSETRKAIMVERRAARKASQGDLVRKHPKQDLLNQMVERGRTVIDMPTLADGNSIVMNSTKMENSFICEPQKSNTGGRVFGGFLIHKAYMLAQANAYMFSGERSNLDYIDEITFKKPVEIGDMIRLRSRVVYVSHRDHAKDLPRKYCIEITCNVVKPETKKTFMSNKFIFVFQCTSTSTTHRIMLPGTMEEANALYDAAMSMEVSEEQLLEDYKH
jgi:acyl-coenzyme A thioesterase 9